MATSSRFFGSALIGACVLFGSWACARDVAYDAVKGDDSRQEVADIEVGDVKVAKVGDGLVFTALARHTGKVPYRQASVSFDLFDGNGTKVGNASASRPDFKPGEKWEIRQELMAVTAVSGKVRSVVAL